MKKIKTIIIEDVVKNIENMTMIINQHLSQIEVVGIAKNLDTAYELLSNKDFFIDLVISDIELPGGTSFDLFQKLHKVDKINFELIFVTAYDANKDYRSKAFRLSAVDFIEKPININKFVEAVNTASERIIKKIENGTISVLLQNLEMNQNNDNIIGFHQVRGYIEFVTIRDVLYLEADGPITHIFMKSGKKMTATKNLGFYGKILLEYIDFIQIADNKIINADTVQKYHHGERNVVFANGLELTASRREAPKLRDYLTNKSQPKSTDWMQKIKEVYFKMTGTHIL